MQTTLTLDNDVARQLEREVRRTGAPLEEVISRLLRLGLKAASRPPRKAFVVTPRKLGLRAGMKYDNVQELLDTIERLASRR